MESGNSMSTMKRKVLNRKVEAQTANLLLTIMDHLLRVITSIFSTLSVKFFQVSTMAPITIKAIHSY
jgi:hypothetical protein